MHYYKIFGLIVSSQISFRWPLEQILSPAAVACEIAQAYNPLRGQEVNLFYTSPIINIQTIQPKIQIFSLHQGLFLSYSDFGHFEILPGKITYYLQNTLDQPRLEALLFRTVLILWLEQIGMPVLHASGIVIHDLAIGFLANSSTGKSTLAAAFAHNDAKFLTDDIFPIEAQDNGYLARPSYAWLRLLPEAARALGYKVRENDINPEKFAVRLDEAYIQFCPEPIRLAALYLPVRRDGIEAVSIKTLSTKQAYLGLIQHSFAGQWLVKSPLNPQRMSFFVDLVKKIPIKQLVYPSGYEHLPAVVEAVKQDLGL